MSSKDDWTGITNKLRKQAEEISSKNADASLKSPGVLSPEETLRTLHELQVHQIELEMQNEALLQVQAELEAARARYFDLYELAPVGYCTLDEHGLIKEVNLTAATMLDINRGLLINQPFACFILFEDQDTYFRLNKTLNDMHSENRLRTDIPQACELRMKKKTGAIFWVLLEAGIARDSDENPLFRITLNDITERKQAEEALQRAYDEMEQCVLDRTEELRLANEELQADIVERIRTEEELRESESRYRELFGAESDAIVLIDNATGSILDANLAAETLYGFNHDELLSKTNTDLSAEPEETQRATDGVPDIPDQVVTIPLRFHRKKDGAVFPVEIKARFFVWKGQSVHLAAIRDITERKRNEDILQARLRLSECYADHTLDELLQCTIDEAEILTGSSIGFFHFVERDQNTLLLQSWSTNTKKTLCSAENMRGHYDIEEAGVWVDCLRQRCPVIHNDYAALPHRKGLPPGHSAVQRELLIPIMRSDLVVAILGVGNKAEDYDNQDVEALVSLANLAWDIILRKQSDEALRESEVNYRTVADYTSDWEYWMTPEGELRYVSPSCEGITGYRVEEFKENTGLLVDIVHPDDRDNFREYILHKSNESVVPGYHEMDFRILNRAGQERWIAHVCQRVYAEDGKYLGLRISNRDITQRKLVENELARAAERDHHIAEVFQKTVVPTQLPIQPPGYEIATKYQPASQEAEVCGDFCDIFDLGDGYIGISIGDIVGKGLLAAMRVTAAKNMIRSYAFLYDRPSKVMTLVNDALCRDIAMENDMLTAFFAVLDTKIGILTYSNAGHEPPLLWQASGMAKLLNVGGPMFCGLGKQVYLEGYLNLQPGDVFVTVTDGITEAGIDRCAQHYGAEGVINCMSTHASRTAEQISTAIMESAKKFANGPLRDDASVLVIKKTE